MGCGAATAPVGAAGPAPSAAPPAPVASSVAPTVADESFRSQPPVAPEAKPFLPPAPDVRHLDNGIPVVLLHEPSKFETLEVVACGPVPAGVGVDVRELMLVAMLRGTTKADARALTDRYASIFMTPPAWTWERDGVRWHVTFKTADLDAATDTMADIVERPAFEKAAFERAREQQATLYDDTSAAWIGQHVLPRVLFGATGYGEFVTAKDLRGARREDVIAAREAMFEPSAMTLVASGGAAEDKVLAALDRAFGALPASKNRVKEPAAVVPALPGPRLVVVDEPGAKVAVILEGFALPGAGTRDNVAAFLALQVLMGQGANGRMLPRLKDELKLVTRVGMFHWTAHWAAAGGFDTSAPVASVPKILTEVDALTRALAKDGPTAEELDVERNAIAASFVHSFETPVAAAEAYGVRLTRRLPPDAVVTEANDVATVGADAVRAAGAKYLDPSRGRYVLVGDLRELREPLFSLGWGPIEVRDKTGAVLRVERPSEGH
jgi:predicted Zn-dependent peptidase